MGRFKKGENSIKYFLMPEFRQAIINFLKKTNQTQYNLSSVCGFDPSRLSRIMAGSRIFLPNKSKLKKLAERIEFDGQLFEEKLLRDPEDRS